MQTSYPGVPCGVRPPSRDRYRARNGSIQTAAIDGTTAGAQNFSLIAGTGTITVSGRVGGSVGLGPLAVTSGGAVSFTDTGVQHAARGMSI